MKNTAIAIIVLLSLLHMPPQQLLAGGTLRKLKTIADSMGLMDKVSRQEGENYRKAKEFIKSPEIMKGLTGDFILERCGEPVARVRNDTKWVYKPPSSTFFKGEKIYFIFDENSRLISWEDIYQK